MNGEAPSRKRAAVFAGIIAGGLFVSLAVVAAARQIVARSYPDLMQPFVSWLPSSLAVCLAVAALCAGIIGVGFYALFSRFPSADAALQRLKGLRFLPLRFQRRDVAVAAIVLFVLWLPILAIMYPTGLTADTFNQLYQFQTQAPTYYPTTGEMINAEFIDHHPVFDTLLYGFFWQAGAALGNQNAGLFALVIVQSVVLAGEQAALVCYLERLNAPWVARLAGLVFFALFPLFGHYAATVLKDVTYLTLFLPWVLMWVEAARTRGAVFDRPSFLVAFMLLGGASILAKKLGLFVFAPCLVVLVALLRGRRLRLAISGAASIVVFAVLLPAIVSPLVGGVAPGGRQEALGPAIQHVTALVKAHPDALSAEELEDVNRVFDVGEAVAAYEAPRTDGAKSAFKSSATSQDVARFLQIWAAQGVRHPDVYLTSTAMTAGMLYAPFLKLTYYSGEDLAARAENYAKLNPDFAVSVAQPANLVQLNDQLEFNSIESAISDLPVISLFFTSGFYGGWIPFIALVTVLFARRPVRERLKENTPLLLMGLVPALVSSALMIVSPVASPRYVLPLLYTAPLLVGWAWYALQKACNPLQS